MQKGLALLVLAVIAISGCTAVPGMSGSSGSGVVIEAFEPDFPHVFAGETVNLRTKITNVGDVDATQANIDILGVDKKSITNKCNFDSLLAKDPARGTEGETQTCTLVFSPDSTKANIPAGLTVQFTPIARLSYRYSTTTIKSLSFFSADELRVLQDSGRPIPAETVSTTAGPLALSITTKGPIRFFDDNKKVTFPVEITLSNTGGGVVCSHGSTVCGADTWNTLQLKLILPDGVTVNNRGSCSGITGGQNVQLFRGQSNTITCKVTATLGDVQNVQKLFTAQADYGYFVEQSATIQVTGRESAQSSR